MKEARQRSKDFARRLEAVRRRRDALYKEQERLDAWFQEELDRIQQDLADGRQRVEAELQKLGQQSPNWIEELIHPIRDALQERFPDWRFEVMGPFGIAANTSIWGTPPGAEEPKGWLEFRPKDLATGEVEVVQTWEHTGRYNPGTMGELNGLNHPTMPMPDGFEDLLALFLQTGPTATGEAGDSGTGETRE